MSAAIFTWDLPSGEGMKIYKEKTQGIISAMLKPAGVKEVRGYRNPLQTSPQAMGHIEFDSLASWQAWMQSEDYSAFLTDLRSAGATNISVQIWEASPVVPEPLKP